MKIVKNLITLLVFALISMDCKLKVSTQNYPDVKAADALLLKRYQKLLKYPIDSMGFPRSMSIKTGEIKKVPSKDWTSGFFVGNLWQIYQLTGDARFKDRAAVWNAFMEKEKFNAITHDMGFKIFGSFGKGLEVADNVNYKAIVVESAETLTTRFNKKVGSIRSWDFNKDIWEFPIIIDNMMNLEYLYWSANEFKKPEYADAASTHALTTIKNHFRKDYSSYHLVDYDAKTGKVIHKGTHQGVTDDSAWARGQAWGLYGYTMCYANTKNPKFLQQAEHIASFIMNHPRMPKDKIPVWDFDVHNAMDTEVLAPRDASAAAVIASALLDLSTQVKDGKKYADYAEDILKSLSSDAYLAKPGENSYFLLKHSVGAFLYNSEIDTPLDYADYYYLEALKRYASIKKIQI